MENEERFNRIEEAILTMKDLLVSHDERLESYLHALQESREDFNSKLNSSAEDFNFKLNALIDAQMRNEAEIRELKEASKSQLKRIENIENK